MTCVLIEPFHKVTTNPYCKAAHSQLNQECAVFDYTLILRRNN